MIVGRRYRIYPTKEQEVFLNKSFGCCRWIYNYFLELRNKLYDESKQSVSCYEMMNLLPQLKKEHGWLSEVSAQSLQKACAHLDVAFTNFFRKLSDYPKFKSRKSKQSFEIPQFVRIEGNKLYIPKVREGIKVRYRRELGGEIKSSFISRDSAGRYFVSFSVEIKDKELQKVRVSPETSIGVDLGLLEYATLSTGEVIENPKYFTKLKRRLAKAQRQLAKKTPGSNNFNKQRKRVAKVYAKITDQRVNFLHNLTYRLTHENQVKTICIEDLKIQDMLKDKKLSRCIADASWYEFRRQLQYKCDWYGINLVIISQYAPSTKLCQVCGHINNGITLADRVWTCPKCGTVHQRDLNAARNIRTLGLEQFYREHNKLY